MTSLILDGNSIVNRAFFGVRMLNSPDGTPTNAIFGFFNILHKLIRMAYAFALMFIHQHSGIKPMTNIKLNAPECLRS